MPTPSQGQKAVLKITDVGAVLRDISNVVTDTGMNRLRDMLDISVIGGATAKSYLPGQQDGTIPIDGFWDATVDGYLAGLDSDTTPRAFEFYPAGNSGGGGTNVKYSGTFFVSKHDDKTGAGDAARFSSELQITGGWSRALV